jgi:hypothetical protein
MKSSKRTSTRAAKPSKAAGKTKAPESNRFVEDLLVRGEAAELRPDGTLPLEATHVVRKKKDGSVVTSRVRFKAY